MTETSATPLMRQYSQVKNQHPDKIVMFRMGDFFEMFGEDAVSSSKVLNIQLTSRGKNSDAPVSMCGIPAQSLEKYLYRLITHGYKVAICDQIEDASQAKGLVQRAVTRVLTPGTAFEENEENINRNNYLCSIHQDKRGVLAIAFCDFSTGEFEADFFLPGEDNSKMFELIAIYSPSEFLFCDYGTEPPKWQQALLDHVKSYTRASSRPVNIEIREPYMFDPEHCLRIMLELFKINSAEIFGFPDANAINSALGSIILYLKETQQIEPDHISRPKPIPRKGYMTLDANTIRNLEIYESALNSSINSSLFHTLNQTYSPMGARRLRKYLSMPFVEKSAIENRLEALEEMIRSLEITTKLSSTITQIGDLERIASRLSHPGFSPRDALALRNCLEKLPELKETLSRLSSDLAKSLAEKYDTAKDTYQILAEKLMEEPSLKLIDGNVIAEGVDADLDNLRSLKLNGHRKISELEAAEKEKTGINNLKIKYNRVFGYFIEVSNSQKHLAPDEYIRRQTLSNAERFITSDLKDLEEALLSAESKSLVIEERIFNEMWELIRPDAVKILKTAQIISEIDVLLAFAKISREQQYTRPEISDDINAPLRISAGRHPVIEIIQGTTDPFVPNDLEMFPGKEFLHLITGPNMGGKSTFMRQSAIIVLMAQIGCFVPASKVSMPIFNRIFTRVGASDNLAKGQSTFMMEMLETASILNQLTDRSLVILDEIGRGTGTYDGMGLARAITEYLHERRVITLFATHYHELAKLEETLNGLKNYQVAVNDSGNEIVFLRKIVPGAAGKSYGIHVAEMAGLPRQIIERAKEILREFEDTEFHSSESSTNPKDNFEARELSETTFKYNKKKSQPENCSQIDMFTD